MHDRLRMIRLDMFKNWFLLSGKSAPISAGRISSPRVKVSRCLPIKFVNLSKVFLCFVSLTSQRYRVCRKYSYNGDVLNTRRNALIEFQQQSSMKQNYEEFYTKIKII